MANRRERRWQLRATQMLRVKNLFGPYTELGKLWYNKTRTEGAALHKRNTEAVEQGIRLAKESAKLIKAHPNLELVYEPELSIVAFKRKGWNAAQYQAWSDALLEKQIGFIPPSKNLGEPILRFAFVNPWTSLDDVQVILDTL